MFADHSRRGQTGAALGDRMGDYAGCRVAVMRGQRVMRVLGVDPGLTRCGLGVVDGKPGSALTLVNGGVARTDAGADIAPRLLALEQEIEPLAAASTVPTRWRWSGCSASTTCAP